MADERLRLTAEVTDQFSGPLGKLESALGRTARAGKQAANDLQKDFSTFNGVLGKSTSALQGMTGPLTAMGAAGLGVGLSLTAIGSALRSFSTGTQQLSILSKETGVTINQLRAFGALGERFGVSADTMRGGVMRFSEEMSRLRKRYGETYSSLQAMNLSDLIEKLVAAPNMRAALDSAMEALSNIGDPAKRRKVAEQLFGVSEIGAVAGQVTGKYREMMDEILRDQGRMTKETERAADDFQKHLSRMGHAIDNLKLKTIGPILKGAVDVLDFNGPDKDKLAYLKRERDELEAGAAGTQPDSFKGRYFRNRREAVDTEIRDLERAIRDGSAKGSEQGVNKALRDKDKSATFQNQSLTGPLNGGRFGGATVQRAAYGGGGTSGGGVLRSAGGGVDRSGPLQNGGSSGRMSPSAPTGPLSGSRDQAPLTAKYPEGLAGGIKQSAKDLGVSAEDLATVISYETGGTFDKWKRGPTTKWGTHRGLIQWGEPQAAKYGVTADMSAGDQMKAVTQYLRDRGVKPGMGIHQIYGAINAGGVSEKHLQMRDAAAGGAPGTVRDKVDYQMGPHRRKGVALLGADRTEVADAAPTMMTGSGERSGDKLMRRLYGDEAPTARGGMGGGKGSLHIQFDNAPAGMRPRASMDDLFKEVTVSKSKQKDMTSL